MADKPKRTRGNKAEEIFLASYACGATVEGAAFKAGFSRRTGHRRLQDPEFQKKLAEYKAEIFRRCVAMGQVATLEATRTLLELVNPANPLSIRLGAAKALQEKGMRWHEMSQIEERLAALEKKLTTMTPNPS